MFCREKNIMSSKKVFAIYDSKSEVYSKPLFTLTKGEMLRTFIDIANDQQTPICQHPEDYCLYYIGEYDELTGMLKPEVHESLGKAIEFKKVAKKEK